MFTIMIGTPAQWLCRAVAAYLSYRLMLTGNSEMLFFAMLYLVFSLAVTTQPPLDFEAWAAAAEW